MGLPLSRILLGASLCHDGHGFRAWFPLATESLKSSIQSTQGEGVKRERKKKEKWEEAVYGVPSFSSLWETSRMTSGTRLHESDLGLPSPEG